MIVSSVRAKSPMEIILSEFAILSGTDQKKIEEQIFQMLQDLKKLCYQNNINLTQIFTKLEESECQNEAKDREIYLKTDIK